METPTAYINPFIQTSEQKKHNTMSHKLAMEQTRIPHVAILPSPSFGHLRPLAELARKLTLHHNFSVTFLTLSIDSQSQKQQNILATLPETVNIVALPPVLSKDVSSRFLVRISLAVTRSLPFLKTLLETLKSTSHLVALIVDPFGTDAFDLAREIGVAPYIFFTSNSFFLCHFLHLPTRKINDPGELVKLPGCVTVHAKDLPSSFQDPESEDYKLAVCHGKRFKEAEGILVNSFMDLEPETIKALNEGELGNPAVYPVGPIIFTGSSCSDDEFQRLRWLDEQPCKSVLFISFGSEGTLLWEQLNELAWGLEMSKQRFLWVVRSPHKEANSALKQETIEDPFEYLPDGFLDRTKGLGLVVPDWAPQTKVLTHDSIGGFASHCGWNSTLESIINGVPMIAWPLYAEQKINSVMLVEDVKIAWRPMANDNGLIEREEIAKVVTGLMDGEEGKEARKKVQWLSESAKQALAEGGSSHKYLSDVVGKWKAFIGDKQINIPPA